MAEDVGITNIIKSPFSGHSEKRVTSIMDSFGTTFLIFMYFNGREFHKSGRSGKSFGKACFGTTFFFRT